MATTISFNDSMYEITITCGGSPYTTTHPKIREFHTAVCAWLDNVNAEKLLFEVTATPGVYKFNWDHNDGRKWKQTVNFNTNPTNPKLTFDINDANAFSDTETLPHVAIRRLIIDMYNDLGIIYVKAERQ